MWKKHHSDSNAQYRERFITMIEYACNCQCRAGLFRTLNRYTKSSQLDCLVHGLVADPGIWRASCFVLLRVGIGTRLGAPGQRPSEQFAGPPCELTAHTSFSPFATSSNLGRFKCLVGPLALCVWQTGFLYYLAVTKAEKYTRSLPSLAVRGGRPVRELVERACSHHGSRG